ncbi:putative bifunctional diguanylate cyclase/phosphodiesterase [Catenuloplanes atrovinosus]|uniref:Diguanylate cyclase (GGDEF)-like protein n=1 Tax=Catenuloplanes atrovinosus TaxID=137266 RepID=A0AAE3YS17_9ACTN|nr:bifunctional diguanylate cyclase/phosphodiesterase [Catenuloplanes atrovinosus]MDR7276726.1 diguanylate cyclase (GGDEF)-like protein [Catenuloplanes atrovinosus]
MGGRRVVVSAPVVLSVAIVAAQVVALVLPETRSAIFGLSLLTADGLGVVYSLRAARHRARVTWRLAAAGRALSLVTTISFAVDAAVGSIAVWWVGVVAGLGMFGCLAASVLSISVRRMEGRQRWAFAAETYAVFNGAFMLVWYFALHPTLHGGPNANWTMAVGYPLGNLLLGVAVCAVLLRGGVTRLGDPVTTLLGGVLFYAIADTLHASVGARGEHAPTSATVVVSLSLASLVMTVAAMRADAAGSAGSPPRPAPVQAPSWSAYLPFVSIAAGNTLMFGGTLRGTEFDLWGGLVLAQTGIIAALLVRQVISLRDSRELAVTDTLTGLANLAGLRAGLDRAAHRREGVAMLVVDLDDFKPVNDRYGHDTGNRVLIEVSRALRAHIRSADIAARVGGDEFVVVLTGVEDRSEATGVASRILAALTAAPVRVGADSIPVRASIGVAFMGPDEDSQELQHRADLAMYEAKRSGKHLVKLYEPSMVDRRARDGVLAELLGDALHAGELQVVYQPLVDLSDGRPVGVEALVRWHHRDLGPVSPMEFIPVAERTGMITTLGLWVLEEACRQVRAWQLRRPGCRIYASVNISPRQLQEPTLVGDVLAVLSRTGLPATDLVLEITESAIVDEHAAVPALADLRAHGVRIAIDDFGTGYSSLQYLTRLPVDVLKIDRSFVSQLDSTPEGAAVAEAVIRLGQVLGLRTIAEGIETPAQAAELQLLGCGHGQGYLFARPMPAADLDDMMGTAPIRG